MEHTGFHAAQEPVGNAEGPVGFDRPLMLTPAENFVGYAINVAAQTLIFLVTCTAVAAVLLIFAYILFKAMPFFEEMGLLEGIGEIFGSTAWYPAHDTARVFGMLAIIFGSLYVTAIAIIVAVPLSLFVAVFLSDIVPFSARQVVKPIIELLAAIPSVTFGFFAILIVKPWMQDTLGVTAGDNALNCGVILAFMAMPTIVSVSEDSLTSIGRGLREGSYALGATRAEMVFGVAIPAAKSGIIAGVILGIMRAIGETMLVLMACGTAAKIPEPIWNITEQIHTITAVIAGEMGETAEGSVHRSSLFVMALILLVFTLILNGISGYFMAKNKKKTGGGV